MKKQAATRSKKAPPVPEPERANLTLRTLTPKQLETLDRVAKRYGVGSRAGGIAAMLDKWEATQTRIDECERRLQEADDLVRDYISASDRAAMAMEAEGKGLAALVAYTKRRHVIPRQLRLDASMG